MRVTNRDGELVVLDFHAIKQRLLDLCFDDDFEKSKDELDLDLIVVRTISGMEDHITTSKLDELSAMICASYQSRHYLYDVLAGRIMVSNLHKNVRRIVGHDNGIAPFSLKFLYIADQHPELLNADVVAFVRRNTAALDAMMDYSRDEVTYFSFRTLEKAYLLRAHDAVIESPQDMWMRVSVAIHANRTSDASLDDAALNNIATVYFQMSKGLYTHATPTLFNAGMRHEQMSSCYLLGTDDSLQGIFKTVSDCAQISKWAGGLGVHVSNVRAKGAVIKSTHGKSDGIIPMLKVYNETARYCNQCFVPDTVVYTSTGCKAIKDIVVDDLVLTSDGTFRPVVDVVINHKNEDILVIQPRYGGTPLECTRVHEIYALTGQTTWNHDIIRNRLENGITRPEFVSASELALHDFMAYPIPKVQPEVVTDMTQDDCRFYGTLLGTTHKFNLHDNIIECGITAPKWVEQYLASRDVQYWRDANTVWFEFCPNIPFSYADIYDANGFKLISDRMMKVSNDNVLQIVVGLLQTNYVGEEFFFSTDSKSLMESLRYLLLRLGIPSSGRPRRLIETDTVIYDVSIPKDPLLCEALGLGIVSPSNKRDYFVWNGLIFNRIDNIYHRPYEGDVYDLCVEDNHNYVTNCGLVHNSGRRKGSIAIYLEPWHADVFEFVELRRQTGAESVRARDLFLAMWIPDEFMRRVVDDGDWFLMSPDECPGLQDACGEKFTELYNEYVSQLKFTRKVKARSLWTHILQSQIETGTPYIGFKDTINQRCNQNNLGTIRSSNLCIEINEYSDKDWYAVCNLASIAVNRFYDVKSKTYDYDGLREAAAQITRNLDRVIDLNFYPVPETERSNMHMRPMGIGVQGLSDLYNMMRLTYGSDEALNVDAHILETIYYGAMTSSIELAKQHGAYPGIDGSMFQQGILQFDLYDNVRTSGRWDWDAVRKDLKEFGCRHSMLTALMPTASTSQILGNTECFEPIQSNVFKRTTLAGEFLVVNKYLMQALMESNMWTDDVRDQLIRDDGSTASVYMESGLKPVFRTVWEVGNKAIIDHAVARAPFVDQAQSMNLFQEVPNYAKLNSALVYGWQQGLKTGCYYLRSKPAAEAMKMTVSRGNDQNTEVSGPVCRMEADCVVCSS